MTNVGHSTIIKLSKVALFAQTRNKSTLCTLARAETSNQVWPCNNLTKIPHSCYLLGNLIVTRHLSQGNKNTSHDQKPNEKKDPNSECDENKTQDESDNPRTSSSSAYQKYHRSRYQRKKEFYESGQNGSSGRRPNINNNNVGLNHYQRLNISPESDTEAIKSAYYSLSKEYHPDIVGTEDEQSVENFRKITEAYDILSDPQQKAAYDKEMGLDLSAYSSYSGLGQSTNPNREYKPIYRARDAEMVFRSRLETAMELEKMRNPRKFQAGKFDEDLSETRKSWEYQALSERLRNLESQFYRSNDDGSFYRSHLADTIRRRRESASCGPQVTGVFHGAGSGGIGASDASFILIGLSALLIAIIYVTINLLFDIDLAADLDALFDGERVVPETPDESSRASDRK